MWTLVQQEMDTAQYLRESEGKPLTSPRFDDLSEAEQRQVTLAVKSIRGQLKAGIVAEGKARINASGHKHHDEKKMSLDPAQADFVAISIGRVI